MAYFVEKPRTEFTPYVLIDEEKGYIKLEGESFHSVVIEFFQEIFDWMNEFFKKDFTNLTFDCMMYYINSSTSKLLLNMLLEMDKHCTGGKKVVVNWFVEEGNDAMMECGEDFQEEMENLEFNIKNY